MAAMQFNKGAHERKPQSGAAMARAFGVRFETVKHAIQNVGRDTAPFIFHDQLHILRRITARAHNDTPAWPAETDGIRQKIEEDLPHAFCISREAANIARHVECQQEMGFCQPVAHSGHSGFDGFANIGIFGIQP